MFKKNELRYQIKKLINWKIKQRLSNLTPIVYVLLGVGALALLLGLTKNTGNNLSAWAASPTPATAVSIVIAASDSSLLSKQRADYVVDGTADEEQIIAAMNQLAPVGGGSISLLEGTYNIDSEIQTAPSVKHWPNGITIRGQGERTILHNRMNGGTSNDRYVINVWGNTTDPVSYVGVFDLKIIGDEYTTNNMSQHGILLKYVKDAALNNLYFENLGEEGLVIGDEAERVAAGAIFGKNLGSGLIDIGGSSKSIDIQNVIGETTNQVEDSAMTGVFEWGGKSPERVNIGFIQAIRPGSKGLQIVSASNINVGQLIVECQADSFSKKSIGALQVYKNSGVQPQNVNVKQVISRNCGARANNPSISLQGDYLNIDQVTVERPYGHGLSADNLHYSHVGQVTVRDAADTGTSAYNAITIASTTSDNTFDQILVRGWSYSAANGIGVAISGHRNIFGKIQIAGDTSVVGADSWDVWVSASASNNIIESAILSGHGTGGLSNSSTSTHIGKIIKGTSGTSYKPYQTSGTSLIPSGVTSTTVTHGLGFTPSAENIFVTQANNPSNDPGNIWVDNINSTSFRVNSKNDPGASGLSFSWQVVTP
ncbi:hypothetical protein HYW35_04295 [Candidatus Saccharibacteria bacterium]|nr:hypothetical protein [Candidatus Saccharibacteria bacterium]